MALDFEKVIELDSDFMEQFRSSSVNLFNQIPRPRKGDERERYVRYMHYWKLFSKSVSGRTNELMNALTDMVKDSPTIEEIEKANNLLKDFLFKDNKNLLRSISVIEKTLSVSEKNGVIIEQLRDLKKSTNEFIARLISVNWAKAGSDHVEDLYALSQVFATISMMIDSLNDEFSRNNNINIKPGMAAILYLVLRVNAYLLNKISKESLLYTLSAVRVYVYRNSTYLQRISN